MQFSSFFNQNHSSAVVKFSCLLALTGALVACGDGTDGANGLLSTEAVPAGALCAAGGTRVNAGKDTNDNGVLDTSEILSSAVVCNGANGSPGQQGPQGPQGPKGDDPF